MLVGVTDLVQHDRTEEAQRPYDQDVVNGCAASWAEMTEDAPWQDIIAPHAKEQARGAETARQRAAERRQDQDESHGIKQECSADTAANVHKRCFQIWEPVPVGPNKLCQIHQ